VRPDNHSMNVEIDSLSAAIDDAARALVTPPPDEGFVARVVSLLPERAGGAHRLWWVPGAAVAALVAGLALRPGLEPSPWHGLEQARQPFAGSAGTSVPTTSASALVAIDPWERLSPAASSVAPDVPRVGTRARGYVRVRMPVRLAEEDAWGLRAIELPPALIVVGLASTDPPPTEVAPLALAALPPPAALHDMKE